MSPARLRAVVAVPAHDEEAWIGACLDALAAQEDLGEEAFEVLVVLDACTDGTRAAVAAAAVRHPGLRVATLPGPGRGAGRARAVGMDAAAARLAAAGVADGLVVTTDADTRADPGWLAAQLRLQDGGARVIAGRIVLDPAGLEPDLLAARERDAATRLAVVRAHDPQAEHHQCSGASLALTASAYEEVGGLPDRAALEDEALEAALRRHGIPVVRSAEVRVTTAARTAGRASRGLAQALRLEAWAQGDPAGAAAPPEDAGEVRVVVPERSERRPGAALAAALGDAAAGTDAIVVLPPGTDPDDAAARAAAATLAAALRAPGTLLALGVPGGVAAADALSRLVVGPALNLHVPDLAGLRAPLTPWLAVRPALLDDLDLPAGEGAGLALVLAAHARAGLGGLAQVGLAVARVAAPDADARVAYALLALLAAHAGEPPEPGTAHVRPGPDGLVTERVDLDHVAVLRSPG